MKRFTYYLDTQLFERIKIMAVLENKSISNLITDLILKAIYCEECQKNNSCLPK